MTSGLNLFALARKCPVLHNAGVFRYDIQSHDNHFKPSLNLTDTLSQFVVVVIFDIFANILEK